MSSSNQSAIERSENRSPLDFLGRFAVIAVFSIFAGILIPGLVAFRSGVFFYQSMVPIVERKHPEVSLAMEHAHARQEQLRKAIIAIDEHITADPTSAPQLTPTRQAYESELRRAPTISVQPFYLHVIMYFWPTMYFGLGSVAFILRPPLRNTLRFFRKPLLTAGTATAVFILNMWPLLFRTLSARSIDQGRTVFAYTNPDVDAASFAIQQLNFAIFSLLLAIIWIEWSAWASERRAELKRHDGLDHSKIQESVQRLSTTLLHWQATFLAASIGFMVYTAIFWTQIIVHQDLRFVLEAINAYILWLVTVILTATPLVFTWRAWQVQKIRIISAVVQSSDESQVINSKLTAIHELQPMGLWNMTASGLTVLTSFAVPIVQALVKRAG
jgi:hypothetical protein